MKILNPTRIDGNVIQNLIGFYSIYILFFPLNILQCDHLDQCLTLISPHCGFILTKDCYLFSFLIYIMTRKYF